MTAAKKNEDETENVQHKKKKLIEVRDDGVRLSDPCKKQIEQNDAK
jgi:hypothetical protein